MSASYEIVARVGKARGLEGKVTATESPDLPLCLHEGLVCHVVPPSLYGPRIVTVESIAELSGSSLELSFAEVTSVDDAEQLVGRKLLACIDDIDLEATGADWLVGLQVVDARYGALGSVTELIETPANDVIVVEGPYGEVLIPLVEAAVDELPEEEDGIICTHVMDGLIEVGPQGEGR